MSATESEYQPVSEDVVNETESEQGNTNNTNEDEANNTSETNEESTANEPTMEEQQLDNDINESEPLEGEIPDIEEEEGEIDLIEETEQILNTIEYSECPFSILTPDLVIHIFSFLDIPDLVSLQLVSSDWFTYCRCDSLWNPLYETTDWTLSPPIMEPDQGTWYDLYRLHYEKELAQLS